jgi:hypothetical protein
MFQVHDEVRRMMAQFRAQVANGASEENEAENTRPAKTSSFAAYGQWKRARTVQDEVDLYLQEMPCEADDVEAEDILEWWRTRVRLLFWAIQTLRA